MASMKLDLTRIPLLELYKYLECDANGLTETEARRRLLELRVQQHARRPPALMRFAGFLRNPFAIIYAACAIALVALTWSNWPTFIGMVGLLLGNIALCLVVEQNTLNARRKLRRHPDFSACLVQVKRDGVWTFVVAADLVRGDVIMLVGRYVVPAQCRLIVCNRLRGAGYAEKVVGDVCQL
ncbi:hypothetical protein C8F01DRAFT_1247567 [Mycena amicta]|nr:hypothetical protein C8F01DRAFT_1247567 [Mycena amicta]